MEKRKMFRPLAAAAGMVALILDSKTALAGAMEGISLCIRTVIPSLFPFLFLSGVFSASCPQPGQFSHRLGKAFAIPQGAESILVPMLFGGYPVGAQCLNEMYCSGGISKKQAERMLAYCSNAGPAFLFGILPAAFASRKLLWLTWGIQITSILITARLFSPGGNGSNSQSRARPFGMEHAATAMLKICGWVVLFRVLISFLNRWFLHSLPSVIQVGVMGLLELSNGCCMLNQIADGGTRFVLCNALLSFGGLCVAYQTGSVCPGLKIAGYLIGKLCQCICSLLLSCIFYYRQWFLLLPIGIILLAGTRIEKKGRNRETIVV